MGWESAITDYSADPLMDPSLWESPVYPDEDEVCPLQPVIDDCADVYLPPAQALSDVADADLVPAEILPSSPLEENDSTLETVGWGLAYLAAGVSAVALTGVAVSVAPALGVSLGAYELGALVLASGLVSGTVLGGIDTGVQLTQEAIGTRESFDYARLGNKFAQGAEIGMASSVGALTGVTGSVGMKAVLGEEAASKATGKAMVFGAGWLAGHTGGTASVSAMQGDDLETFAGKWEESAPYSLGLSVLCAGAFSALSSVRNIPPASKPSPVHAEGPDAFEPFLTDNLEPGLDLLSPAVARTNPRSMFSHPVAEETVPVSTFSIDALIAAAEKRPVIDVDAPPLAISYPLLVVDPAASRFVPLPAPNISGLSLSGNSDDGPHMPTGAYSVSSGEALKIRSVQRTHIVSGSAGDFVKITYAQYLDIAVAEVRDASNDKLLAELPLEEAWDVALATARGNIHLIYDFENRTWLAAVLKREVSAADEGFLMVPEVRVAELRGGQQDLDAVQNIGTLLNIRGNDGDFSLLNGKTKVARVKYIQYPDITIGIVYDSAGAELARLPMNRNFYAVIDIPGGSLMIDYTFQKKYPVMGIIEYDFWNVELLSHPATPTERNDLDVLRQQADDYQVSYVNDDLQVTHHEGSFSMGRLRQMAAQPLKATVLSFPVTEHGRSNMANPVNVMMNQALGAFDYPSYRWHRSDEGLILNKFNEPINGKKNFAVVTLDDGGFRLNIVGASSSANDSHVVVAQFQEDVPLVGEMTFENGRLVRVAMNSGGYFDGVWDRRVDWVHNLRLLVDLGLVENFEGVEIILNP